MTDSRETMRWLARPYEGDNWMVTDVAPTDELRRHVEYRRMPANLSDAELGRLFVDAALQEHNG